MSKSAAVPSKATWSRSLMSILTALHRTDCVFHPHASPQSSSSSFCAAGFGTLAVFAEGAAVGLVAADAIVRDVGNFVVVVGAADFDLVSPFGNCPFGLAFDCALASSQAAKSGSPSSSKFDFAGCDMGGFVEVGCGISSGTAHSSAGSSSMSPQSPAKSSSSGAGDSGRLTATLGASLAESVLGVVVPDSGDLTLLAGFDASGIGGTEDGRLGG